MDKKIIEELSEKLTQEKEKITKELESFATKDKNVQGGWDVKLKNDQDADMDEKANEVEEYSNLLPVEHSLELKLKDVNIALEKIKTGDYGICEKCGKKIEEARLEAMPEARLCMSCNNKK